MVIKFFVAGIPAPAGSKKAFINPRRPNVPIVTDDSKRSRPWENQISGVALERWDRPPLDGELAIKMVFYFPRPKSHFGTGKNSSKLKASAPAHHTTKPDLTKLIRAVEDALTGVLWRDDALVYKQEAWKLYTNYEFATPGVWIYIMTSSSLNRPLSSSPADDSDSSRFSGLSASCPGRS